MPEELVRWRVQFAALKNLTPAGSSGPHPTAVPAVDVSSVITFLMLGLILASLMWLCCCGWKIEGPMTDTWRTKPVLQPRRFGTQTTTMQKSTSQSTISSHFTRRPPCSGDPWQLPAPEADGKSRNREITYQRSWSTSGVQAMGKRGKRSAARRPVFRRRFFDPDELETDEISLTKEEMVIARTVYEINSGAAAATRRNVVDETNTSLLPHPGTHTYVPFHYVTLLLSVFFLILLVFCRERPTRPKPAATKSNPTSSRRPPAFKRSITVMGTPMDKDLHFMERRGSNPKTRKLSLRRKSAL
ncbi:hypothetical protein Bbelb_237540 [Branchiostoma belcheri]|nr:hypothetical protein Bbelb_237540 [Branchiostoma belcheri]